uniref:Uncharacterized protein n=1 Tax=Anabas testudineus TaxID=64144 RepID=A0A7N6FE45_ANATE
QCWNQRGRERDRHTERKLEDLRNEGILIKVHLSLYVALEYFNSRALHHMEPQTFKALLDLISLLEEWTASFQKDLVVVVGCIQHMASKSNFTVQFSI